MSPSSQMRVLVIGSGAREHALAWKLSQEAEVFCTPGNPGIASVATIEAGSVEEVCKRVHPDLVVIGPENPLIDGMADEIRALGYPVFGPGADGSALEGSKAFSKELMLAAGVPTALSSTCHTADEAREAVARFYADGRQAVVKASGAALGKGVVVCSTIQEAKDAIDMMMVDGELGSAGETVVIEERLIGREFSLLSICSGTSFVSLPVAQDYKRALDGDRGPNTGGMGSYSPVPWVSDAMVKETEELVVRPILAELASRGIDYRGVLFSGLMVQAGKVYCLEYNVRFGDPEIQTLVRRIGPGFADLLLAAARGEGLAGHVLDVSEEAVVTVVLASPGYPGSYPKGIPLTIPGDSASVVYFHAGTKSEGDSVVSNGGRVLAVSAKAEAIEAARTQAYAACEAVGFEGGFCRRDIAAN